MTTVQLLERTGLAASVSDALAHIQQAQSALDDIDQKRALNQLRLVESQLRGLVEE